MKYLLPGREHRQTETVPPDRSQGCWTGKCWRVWLEEKERARLGKRDEMGSALTAFISVIFNVSWCYLFIVPWESEELITVVSRKNSQVYQHLCSLTLIYWGRFWILSQSRNLSEIRTLTIIEVEQRHFFFLFLALFLDGLWWRLRFCCLERDERKETWVGTESPRPHDMWTPGLIVLMQMHAMLQTGS